MNRVIFLDIDGVLVTPRAMLAAHRNRAMRAFDPVAVGILNRITDNNSDIRLVVSSTWRMMEECQDVLRAAGINGAFHDAWKTDTKNGVRGEQIARWLETNQGTYSDYVIIDDDSDMTIDQLPHFVKCQFDLGLGLAEYRKICEIFDLPEKSTFFL